MISPLYQPIAQRGDDEERDIQIQNNSSCREKFRFTLFYSFLKLAIGLLLSFSLQNYWQHCSFSEGENDIKCTSTSNQGQCTSWGIHYCKIQLGTNEECEDRCLFGGSITVFGDNTECSASIDSSCICNYWLTTNFLAILLTFLIFFLQFLFAFCYRDYDPQDLFLRIAITGGDSKLYSLLFAPKNCYLSFLEILLIWFAWFPFLIGHGDLKAYIECTQDVQHTDLNTLVAVALPIILTSMEVLKPIVKASLSKKDDARGCVMTVISFFGKLLCNVFRIDYVCRYAMIQLFQAVIFLFAIIFVGLPCRYWDNNYHELSDYYEKHLMS